MRTVYIVVYENWQDGPRAAFTTRADAEACRAELSKYGGDYWIYPMVVKESYAQSNHSKRRNRAD